MAFFVAILVEWKEEREQGGQEKGILPSEEITEKTTTKFYL